MLVRHMKIAKSQKQEIAFPNAQDEARGIKTLLGLFFQFQSSSASALVFTVGIATGF